MGFNPNDPAFMQQLLRLDPPNIVSTLRRLNVEELDRFEPQHPRLQECKAEVMRTTKVLSLAIGSMAHCYCRGSKMWHPYECELAQFPGGMYTTTRRSYLGFYEMFGQRDADEILNHYPNIETLNLMIDLVNVYPSDAMQATLNNVVSLIQAYAPQLVTFRLWVWAPTFVEMEDTTSGHWHSTLKQQFVPNLWPALDAMVLCRILWLELEEEILPVPVNVRVQRREPLQPLENSFPSRLTLRNMTQLEEFHFVGEGFNPYDTMAARLFPLANLSRIYIKNLFPYNDCTIHENFSGRFREININLVGLVLLEAGLVPLEDGQVTFDELTLQLSRFHALTQIGIQLGQAGVRLINVLQILPQLANLQTLQLVVQQQTLFTPREIATMRSRPVRLATLQVFWISLDINMRTHEMISLAALFPGSEPWQWAPQHSPLPSLVCFTMHVREGACSFCADDRTGQDNCIRQAVIRWFEPLVNARPRPPIAKVFYCNFKHRTLNTWHQVKGNIMPQPLIP